VIDGVVLSRTGGRYLVWSDGHTVEAVLRGHLKHRREAQVLVGDHVSLAVHDAPPATIEHILPRRSLLKRRSPGRARGTRAIAANVGQVVVVGAVRQPDWDPYLIDRFLAVAEANRLPASLVINKADLADDPSALAAPYLRAGYAVSITSVRTGQGVEQLRTILTGSVTLLTGPTGVGKSSMLNALVPGLRLRTGEVGLRSQAGRHTTVAVDMHVIDADSFVVDTPGLRDIGLWGLSPLEVGAAFPELGGLSGGCRFDDCQHRGEPGCAVRAAVDDGELSASRYASYRRLLDEAEQAARP
jgi:ribosome biogenesis GTPase